MNEVVLGTVAGILMGPYGANVFDPRSSGTKGDHDATLEVMRVVLAIGLFAIGVELPRSYMAKHMKGLAAMVIPTMTIGWVTVASKLRFFSSHSPNLPHSSDHVQLISSAVFHLLPCNRRLLDPD
jgi:NhaP-type Na+/H+ or K+/H+ antiporter